MADGEDRLKVNIKTLFCLPLSCRNRDGPSDEREELATVVRALANDLEGVKAIMKELLQKPVAVCLSVEGEMVGDVEVVVGQLTV